MQYRQGDVLIESVDQLPANLVELKAVMERGERQLILAHGEATGHSHAIAARRNGLYRDALGVLYLLLLKEELLKHQEHEALRLPPGVYKITRQREYSPQEIRRVRD